jgi:hypothetical protein
MDGACVLETLSFLQGHRGSFPSVVAITLAMYAKIVLVKGQG